MYNVEKVFTPARKLQGPGPSTLGTLQGPWKDQGWSVTIWDLALVSLETLDMFFVAQNAKIQPVQLIFSGGPFGPPPA